MNPKQDTPVTFSEQNPCNLCGKDIRQQMKGCSEISC